MSGSININVGPSTEAANISAFAQGTDAHRGMSFNVASGFDWIDPPLIPGWQSTYFPNQSNYHPLLVNSDYEIASNLFSVEGASSISNEQKKEYTSKIEKIVKDAPLIHAVASRNYILVILTIICLFILYTSPKLMSLVGIIVLFGVLYLVTNVFVFPYATAAGNSQWNTFTNKLNSKINTGKTPQSILDEFAQEHQHDQDLEAIKSKYDQAGMGNNTSLRGSSLTESLVGSVIGSLLKK